MPLPTMTPEQREAALAKASAARKARSELLDKLKSGTITLPEIFESAANDDIVRKTKVASLIKAIPGIGAVRAAQIMTGAQIADNRRIGGLGEHQRNALLASVAAGH